jgi:hypothetical protein
MIVSGLLVGVGVALVVWRLVAHFRRDERLEGDPTELEIREGR